MKRLPIGIESFEKMITGGYYFVDKSPLIRDVRLLSGEVKLITRPRRFGKTLNVDMIRHFYGMDGKDLFEGLKIWDDRVFVKEHYHKYPVLFVSFKEVRGETWREARALMEELLKDLAARILLKMEDSNDGMIRLFRERYIEGEAKTYSRVLLSLTEALYRYYGRKVILLIDEYDVPIEVAYVHSDREPDYYESMIEFMRALLTPALKGNPYLEFAILTGVYRIARESIFSGLNNVAVYAIFENDMADKFGFLEDEVLELLKYYGLEGDMDAVRDWYNGYAFGEVEGIYNPWSVIYYVKERISGKSVEKALQPYWINTSSNDLIIKQIESNPILQEELDKLLSGRDMIVEIDPFLSLREIDQTLSGVWTLLANAGYLKVYQLSADEYKVRLPNKEVEKFYKKVVSNWLERKARIAKVKLLQALKYAMNGRVEGFMGLLKEYIENSLSYFDIGYDDAERVYKAFVLGMLSMATDGYIVETETESGYGRVDVAIYPKDERFGKYALVIELKKADSERALEETAEQALKQISEKGYTAKFEKMGYGVIPIGMVFHGKRVMLKYET